MARSRLKSASARGRGRLSASRGGVLGGVEEVVLDGGPRYHHHDLVDGPGDRVGCLRGDDAQLCEKLERPPQIRTA